ncbi:hypothetical protein [Nocardia sp. NPDC057272]|uniref:hypothetical protein n=1 Tax=Nocardia sp. NPDC057272 TaxID=3346079 RepID=UPI00362535C7
MKLLAIDYQWSFDPADYTDFEGITSCYDYDVVIWDPAHSLGNFNSFEYFINGGRALDAEQGEQLLKAANRRKREFKDFLDMGRTLFVIARSPSSVSYQTGKTEQSGTGKNALTIAHTETFRLSSVMPIPVLSLEQVSGKNFDVVGDGVFQQFLRKFLPEFCYEASVFAMDGSVIARIPGTERILSVSIKGGAGGQVVFLPVPSFAGSAVERDWLELVDVEDGKDVEGESEGGEATRISNLAHEFQLGLIECASRLSSVTEPQPDWVQQIRLIGETEVLDEVESNEKQIAEIQAEVLTLRERLREIEHLKDLVSGTGRALELAVKEVLEVLGGRVEEPEPGRDDWIVHFPEGVAVVEVKGLGKSAGEKNATQLEKWVLGYHDRKGVFPKGILVINAWRNLALPDRTEKAFPDQMLPYATRSQHCLITGAQMLALHQEIVRRPEEALELRKLLLATSGVFPKFADAQFGLPVEVDVEHVIDPDGGQPSSGSADGST